MFRKKFASTIFAVMLLMLFSLTAVNAQTVSDTWRNIGWKLDTQTGVLTLTGQFQDSPHPNSYGTPWNSYSNIISEVRAEEGIVSLGHNYFNAYSSLEKASLPDSLRTIGNHVFSGTILQEITIPSRVTSIGYHAFSNCTRLTTIIFRGNAPELGDRRVGGGEVVFDNTSSLTIYYPNNASGWNDVISQARFASINWVSYDPASGLPNVNAPTPTATPIPQPTPSPVSTPTPQPTNTMFPFELSMSITLDEYGWRVWQIDRNMETAAERMVVEISSPLNDWISFGRWSQEYDWEDWNEHTSERVTVETGRIIFDTRGLNSVGNIRLFVNNDNDIAKITRVYLDVNRTTANTAPTATPIPQPTPTAPPTQNNTSGNINVTINGNRVVFQDQPPVIIDGRTLVPIREVFQALGFDVDWDGNTRTARLSKQSDVILVTIGSNVFTTNGVRHTLDVPAQIINGRTLLPIRLLLESVNIGVDWNAASSTVMITAATSSPQPTPNPTSPPQTTEEANGILQVTYQDVNSDTLFALADGESAAATSVQLYLLQPNGAEIELEGTKYNFFEGDFHFFNFPVGRQQNVRIEFTRPIGNWEFVSASPLGSWSDPITGKSYTSSINGTTTQSGSKIIWEGTVTLDDVGGGFGTGQILINLRRR
jgi:hypothetical protein